MARIFYACAVTLGAIYPLADQFYGERGGRIRDPFGQQWMMGQHMAAGNGSNRIALRCPQPPYIDCLTCANNL